MCYLEDLLKKGITVLLFDFSGSGLSEGEYISLGYYETDDVFTVIKYLNSTGRVSRIALWGRSMGAVTGNYKIKLFLAY